MDATPAQLEEVFKKFGPIKPGGIQVRSHKYLQLQGFCFGFVEFEVASAVQSAIEVNLYMQSLTSILFIYCVLLELLVRC
ncbi:hypothetical protein BHM03_00012657 [Ensete ventricosum]|nr:hypothetical protein BHM03_00012657 [Ensete ventricosum]